jgi:hypothetical protein
MLASLALLLIAACASDSPQNPCGGTVELLHAPKDTTIADTNAEVSLPLDSDWLAFRHTGGAALSYTAYTTAVGSGTVAVVTVDAQKGMLDIIPLKEGDIDVHVVARDNCGNADTASFLLHVKRECPREIGPGEEDYFPISLGRSWSYDYRRTQMAISPSQRSRTMGTLGWTITTVEECMNGERRCDVREEFTGANEGWEISSGEWRHIGDTTWNRTLTFIENDSLELGPYTLRPVPRFYPEGAADTIRVDQSVASVERSLTFAARIGMIACYRKSVDAASGAYDEESFTLK